MAAHKQVQADFFGHVQLLWHIMKSPSLAPNKPKLYPSIWLPAYEAWLRHLGGALRGYSTRVHLGAYRVCQPGVSRICEREFRAGAGGAIYVFFSHGTKGPNSQTLFPHSR